MLPTEVLRAGKVMGHRQLVEEERRQQTKFPMVQFLPVLHLSLYLSCVNYCQAWLQFHPNLWCWFKLHSSLIMFYLSILLVACMDWFLVQFSGHPWFIDHTVWVHQSDGVDAVCLWWVSWLHTQRRAGLVIYGYPLRYCWTHKMSFLIILYIQGQTNATELVLLHMHACNACLCLWEFFYGCMCNCTRLCVHSM